MSSDVALPPSASGYRRVLANPRFRAVFLAGVTSQSGGTIAGVAILWIVFAATHSALIIAFVGIVQLTATISFTLPGGVWVDRYSRAQLMVASDLTRAAAMGGLALCFLLVGFQLYAVLAVVFVVSAAGILFQPAEQTLIPSIVPTQDLADANGIFRSAQSAVSLIASPIGGALVVAVGASLCLLYNTMTYVISATLLFTVYLTLRASEKARVTAKQKHPQMGREIKEGFTWLIHQSPGLWQLSVSALFMNFFNNFLGVFMVIYVANALHGTSLVYGVVLGLYTAGSALGTLLVGRTGAIRWTGKVWVLFYGVGGGLGMLSLAYLTDLSLALPAIFVYGLLLGYAGNAWLTCAQTIVPTEMQGRYFALDGLLSWGVLPISEILGGLLITYHGIVSTLAIGGVGLVISGVLSMMGRDLWRLGVPVDSPSKPLAP